MKISNFDNYVHVLDQFTNPWTVLRDIANSAGQEDAFYVCNVAEIVRQFDVWKTLLPRVEPFYAVKCNNSLTVLEVLAALGTGFDCASKGEIEQVLSLGVSPDRIIFANPAKPVSHIQYSEKRGISLTTFDCATELHKIKRLNPNAKLVIRIRCDAEDAQCPLGIKFGCDPVREAPELLKEARSLDLNVVGVSFHVGSGCRDIDVYGRAVHAAREIFDFARLLGYDFDLLDIGGGFPGDRRGAKMEDIAAIINGALNVYFPDPSVRIIAEPGRFFVSSAYTLACNVHSIRSVDKVDELTGDYHTHRMYFINDGVYGSFNCILYDHQCVSPIPLNDNPMAKMYSSSIWGPTCDGLDQVIEEIILPEMNVGDWFIFENMGAYTLPVASSFNGFPIPKVHIVADEATWQLLKDILPLTEDHFVMGNLPESLKKGNVEPSTKFTLPVVPTIYPSFDAVPYADDIFSFGQFVRAD